MVMRMIGAKRRGFLQEIDGWQMVSKIERDQAEKIKCIRRLGLGFEYFNTDFFGVNQSSGKKMLPRSLKLVSHAFSKPEEVPIWTSGFMPHCMCRDALQGLRE